MQKALTTLSNESLRIIIQLLTAAETKTHYSQPQEQSLFSDQ